MFLQSRLIPLQELPLLNSSSQQSLGESIYPANLPDAGLETYSESNKFEYCSAMLEWCHWVPNSHSKTMSFYLLKNLTGYFILY